MCVYAFRAALAKNTSVRDPGLTESPCAWIASSAASSAAPAAAAREACTAALCVATAACEACEAATTAAEWERRADKGPRRSMVAA